MTAFFRGLLVVALLWCTGEHHAWAQSDATPSPKKARSDVVLVSGDSGVYELAIDPPRTAVLYFGSEVTRVINSGKEHLDAGAKEDMVVIKPKGDLPPSFTANVIVQTKAVRIGLLVRVAERPEDAPPQLTFVSQTVEPIARDRADDVRPRVSGDVRALAGQAWVRDNTAGDELDPTVVAGVAARFAYHGSRFHAYEASVTVAQTGAARYDNIREGEVMGEMLRSALLMRAEVGASVHVPTRITPILRLGVGVQGRSLSAARLTSPNKTVYWGPDEEVFFDLTGSAELGFDFRISKFWSTGIGITATHALPLDGGPTFDSVEGAIHVSWM